MRSIRFVVLVLAIALVGACEKKAEAKYVLEGIDIVSWTEKNDSITLTLSEGVAKNFNAFTAEHKGETIDIYIGDTLFFSPLIQAPATGDQITLGGLKEGELEKLKAALPPSPVK